MAEPRAVTYKDVERVYSVTSEAKDAWNKICNITGAGEVAANDHASIDITGIADSKRSQIDKVLTPEAKETPKKGDK